MHAYSSGIGLSQSVGLQFTRPQNQAFWQPETSSAFLDHFASDVPGPALRRSDFLRATAPAALDGKGVPIHFVDIPPDPPQYCGDPGFDHGQEVQDVFEKGAPGAPRGLTRLDSQMAGEIRPANDLQSTIPDVDRALANTFEVATRALANTRPDQKVVSMSVGMPMTHIYYCISKALGQEKPPPELASQIVALVNQRLETDGTPANKARGEYRLKLKELEARGTTVVVAAGNWRGSEEDKMWRQHDPGAMMNVLAQPPAIVVAATHPDGRISEASAPGGNGRYPTLSAPGEHPPSAPSRPGDPPTTSYATPYVAATIALMLQANPRLTPAQIRQILLETSRPNANREGHGGGHIDREAAVRLARKMATEVD